MQNEKKSIFVSILLVKILFVCLLAAPFLLASKKGRGGMGDTFLIGASGFLLGFCRGIVGLTLALLLYCLFYLAIAALHKIRGQERPLESYPFAPFLAAGFFTAYII